MPVAQGSGHMPHLHKCVSVRDTGSLPLWPCSTAPHLRSAIEGISERGAHLANLNSKAIAVWSGVRTLAPTQTQAGKCERESRETKQAHVPFVVWLEQADHFVTPLPCGGIYDTNVFKGNLKKKKKRERNFKKKQFPFPVSLYLNWSQSSHYFISWFHSLDGNWVHEHLI